MIGGAGLSRARAEELAVLAGMTLPEDHLFDPYFPNERETSSYAWQIDYRQSLSRYFDASFAYINEGHLLAHQRDGGAVQLWAVTPQWHRLALSFGVGPYVYFDTQQADGPPWFKNSHGVGEIYTGSLTYEARRGWFARLSANEIHTPGDVDTHMVLLGVGYHLDDLFVGHAGEPDGPDAVSGRNELGVFGGQTVDNDVRSPGSMSFGVEYRRRATEHVELSADWLNEGDGLDGRHNGIVAAVWLVKGLFVPQFSVGIGAGPYVSLQAYRASDGASAPPAVGMAAMTMSWRLARSLLARLTWYRGFTQDDQDRDVITLGVAWTWGR